MKRSLDFKFLACLAGAAVVLCAGLHFVHGYQVKRNALALSRRSEEAEKEHRLDWALAYLNRYLGFVPGDTDALARYAILLDEHSKQTRSVKEHTDAFFALEQVLRRDPGRGDVRRRLVDVAMSLGRFSDARKHLEALETESPGDAGLEELIGLCEEAKKQYVEAAKYFDRAVRDAPDRLDNYVRLANICRRHLDQAARAEKAINEMVKNNPESPHARLLLARYRIEFDANRKTALDAAAKSIDKARELAPDDLDIVLAAAQLAQARGRTDEARRWLGRGVELQPANAVWYVQLVALEIKNQQPRRALEWIERGLKALPNQGDLLYAWAELLVQQGETERAEQLIAQLGQAGFSRPLVELLHARVLMRRGEYGEPARILETIRLDVPAGHLAVQANVLIGRCQEHLGNPDQALVAYRQAVGADPLSTEARLGRAAALAALGRLDEALPEYRQVLALGRAPAAARLFLVRTLILRNLRRPRKDREWAEVRDELETAGQELPDSAEVTILKAELILQESPGRADQARKLLENARDREPDRVEFWTALANLSGRGANPEDALAVLDQAERRPALAGHLDLRLNRMQHLSRLRNARARKLLAEVEQSLASARPADRATLLQGLAGAYYLSDAKEDARRVWRVLAEEQPFDLASRLMLFDLALQAGREDELHQLLDDIRKIEGPAGVLWGYGEASRLVRLASQQDTPTAERRRAFRSARLLLAEVAKKRPSWYRVPALEGAVEDLEHNPEVAIDTYQQALRLGDRRPGVIRRLVELLSDRHRYFEVDQAIRTLLDQQDLLLSAGLGKLATETLLRTQDRDRALEFALKSVTDDSKEYRDHLWLGQVLWAVQRLDEAKKALRRALALADQVPETWIKLVAFLAITDQKSEAEAAIAEARKKLPAAELPLTLGHCYESLGRLDEAAKGFLAALTARPEDTQVMTDVAGFYMRSDQPAQAEPHLRKILAGEGLREADRSWARRNLALVLASSTDYRRFEEALALIEENIRASVNSDLDQRVKARLLATRVKFRKQAIRLLEDHGWNGPLSPEEQFTLVQLYEADNNWPKAQLQMLQLLSTAEGRKPVYEAHYVRRLLRRGDVAGAATWTAKLEKEEPQALRTKELRARLDKARGRDADAVALLKEAGRAQKAVAGPVAFLLDDLSRQGDGDRLYARAAEEMYLSYLGPDRKPERLLAYAEFLARQGRVALALDRCEEAADKGAAEQAVAAAVGVLRGGNAGTEPQQRVHRWIADALVRKPDSVPLLLARADLLDFQGRYGDAADVYRRVVQKNERNILALNNLAWLLALHAGKAAEGLETVNRAIDIVGPSPELLDTRAVIQLRMGQGGPAVQALQEATEGAPTAAKYYYHLARAQYLTKNRLAARDSLGKALMAGFKPDDLHPLERAEYGPLAKALGR